MEKYKATMIGAVISGICLAIYIILPYIAILFVFPTALSLGLIVEELVGRNHPKQEIIILLAHSVLLLGVFSWYIRKVIHDKKQQKAFNQKRLIGVFAVLQFIVHPMGLYCWLLTQPSFDPDDSMTLFYVMTTLPFTAGVFVVLGLIIDLIRIK